MTSLVDSLDLTWSEMLIMVKIFTRKFDIEVNGVLRRLRHDDTITLDEIQTLQDKTLAKVDLKHF